MLQFNNTAGFRVYCNEILTKRTHALKFFSMAADMHGNRKTKKKGTVIMGMSASQARFLSLTARKTNVEYEGQQINQQRTTLSNDGT